MPTKDNTSKATAEYEGSERDKEEGSCYDDAFDGPDGPNP